MVNWADPETFWLNVINAALGAVTVIALVIVVGGILVEVAGRLRKRLVSAVGDSHALHLPLLGPTMADGGERLRGGKEDNNHGKKI